MYYSETKVIMGGLVHVPILIFIVNFIKGKFEAIEKQLFEANAEQPKIREVASKEEEVKGEEVSASEVKEEAK